MAFHSTLFIANNEHPNKSTYIFIDCLNGLYVIKTQMRHPTLYNSHLDKILLEAIVVLLQQQIQLISYKVCVHANIEGNK